MKARILSLALALVMMLTAALSAVPAAQAADIVPCGTPLQATLFAGQTINAGTVTVANDANYLYVTFTAANGWLLKATHLHVGDALTSIPQTRTGNPKIGNFAYQRSYSPAVTSDTYQIAKSLISLDKNGAVVIAAHADVVKLDASGNVIASETGWGSGFQFTDKGSWATYFEYKWQECVTNPTPKSATETAFARGTGSNAADADTVTCFLNIDADNDGTYEFNRWGWTNGPLSAGTYTFELWAAAGKCDTNKGVKVGTVTVNYNGSTATVSYNVTGSNAVSGLPYSMVETQLYVGSEILARNNGEFTVAPGQYTSIHGELKNVTSDSYTISGLSGSIYVVAHATVAGFPFVGS